MLNLTNAAAVRSAYNEIISAVKKSFCGAARRGGRAVDGDPSLSITLGD